MTSFYSEKELKKIGFRSIGKNVLISKFARLYSPSTLSIGDNVRIDDFCILTGDIKLGSYVHIAAYCGLYGGAGIVMEDFSGLSSRVSIYSVSDRYTGEGLTNPCIPDEYRSLESGPVIMRRHSIIGASSLILPNTVLNEGAAVGAMSLVNGILLEWSIYVGVPVKIIKTRPRFKMYRYEHELMTEAK